ncbi:MAG: SDR family oxidoreductase [Deltaproteobacteria bacterium]|nr:SDR family oxidoreductase [Deltaproteobacteria bacterium]
MTLSTRLDGHHALVCGASAGIGRAAALALASAGCRVTALARSRDRLEALMPQLVAVGAPDARFLVADLDDRPSLQEALDDFLEREGPVDVLVNNSGGPPGGMLLEASEDDLTKAFGRLLLAGHLLVRAVVPGMTSLGWGRIVNVVSLSVREPIWGLGVSNTVRGAVAAWAKTLSLELPPGITVNNVLPGYTATERLHALAASTGQSAGLPLETVEAAWAASVPERRLGDPDEIGAVIAFLASPAASYVRGQSLAVDGGRLHGT